MKTLSVICPVYNEEEIIRQFHAELSRALIQLEPGYRAEIFYVVDRCTDKTLDTLKEVASQDQRVRVLSLSSRFGHQMALLAGIDHARGDAVVMLDSDLQHPPSLIPALVHQYEKGFDIVYTIRKDSAAVGFFRRVTSRIFYKLINTISRVPILESAADFRLISKRVARVFQMEIRERNQFMRGLFGWVGFNRIGVEFQVQSRGGGRSKYSLARLVRFAMEGVVSFSKRPLQAATFVGFGIAVVALILAMVTFFDYFLNSALPSGWTTLVILVSGFSGVQLIFLGVIGEYIGAIFDEVKARPHYIVEEKIGFPEAP